MAWFSLRWWRRCGLQSVMDDDAAFGLSDRIAQYPQRQSAQFVPPCWCAFGRFCRGLYFRTIGSYPGDNKHPDRAFGIAQVVQGAMMFIAFSAAAYILPRWTVSGVYYMLAAVSLLMLFTLPRYPSQGVQRITGSKGDSNTPSYTGLIWIGLVASFLFFANVFGFWTYIERVGQAGGLSIETIGLALGMSQFAAIVGAAAAALASDRFGRAAPLALALAGQMLVLWLLVGQFTPFTFYLGAGLFQALFVLAISYQLGVIAKIDLKGNFLVLVTGFQGLGAAVGPGIAASLITDGDYSRINELAAVACLTSILMFFFIIHRTRNIERAIP
jgi:hypothetical protein